MEERKKLGARRPASIDGFISDGRQLGVRSHSSYQPNRAHATPSLGVLPKSDGFIPLRSGQGVGANPEADEAAVLDEPIILDDIQPKKDKKKLKFRRPRLYKNLKRGGIALAILLLAIPVYLLVKAYVIERGLFRGGGKAPALSSNIDINQLKGEGDGRINVLLLGVGGPGHDGADLTDTIMIASIDPVNNKVGLLSVPRDLWVKVPGDGSEKINAVYALAKESSRAKTLAGQETDGVNAIDKTLESVIGIPIHYHAVVDFKAFQQSVDAVGGVSANIPKELSAYENFWVEGTSQHYLLNVQPGWQHFDGTRALYFARERHNDSDFVRAQRQRLLLSALKDKAFSAGTFSNPVKISNLLSSLGSNVYTDFSLNDMSRLYQILQKIPSSAISSLDLVTPPNDLLTTGNMNGLSIVEPKAGLYDYTAIQNYVRNSLRDGFLAKENAKLAVYNRTSIAGMATTEGNVLKSFGYTVTTIDNAQHPDNAANTVVVDFTKGKDKYTRHYLEGRFGVNATGSVPSNLGITPPAGTDFVIILGTHAATTSG